MQWEVYSSKRVMIRIWVYKFLEETITYFHNKSKDLWSNLTYRSEVVNLVNYKGILHFNKINPLFLNHEILRISFNLQKKIRITSYFTLKTNRSRSYILSWQKIKIKDCLPLNLIWEGNKLKEYIKRMTWNSQKQNVHILKIINPLK